MVKKTGPLNFIEISNIFTINGIKSAGSTKTVMLDILRQGEVQNRFY